MADFQKVNLKKIAICIGLCTFLAICGSDCRPAVITGSVTQTNVRHFEFFARIANPCEIAPASGPVPQLSTTTSTVAPPSRRDELRMDFFQSVATQLELTLLKLNILESNDPSLPECNGISLDSLPGTPLLDHYNEADTLKQTYKTSIYLATHFHLMTLDRQTTAQGENNIPDDQLDAEENLPTWRFLRCGNESESLPTSLQEVTESMENIICTILSSATDEQRASFREPFNRLGTTVLYRYHTACSTLQTRDCLVVREAKQALSLILRKFTKLISDIARHSGNGGNSNASKDDDDMDNSL